MSGKQVGSILSKVVKEDFTEKSSFEQGLKVVRQGRMEIRAARAARTERWVQRGKKRSHSAGCCKALCLLSWVTRKLLEDFEHTKDSLKYMLYDHSVRITLAALLKLTAEE